jgi:hypothetical protein
MDVLDLGHDVSPLARVDVAVHVEGEVGEGAEPAWVEVASLEIVDELLLRVRIGASVAQISCRRWTASSSSPARRTARSRVGDIAGMVAEKSATNPSRGESSSA